MYGSGEGEEAAARFGMPEGERLGPSTRRRGAGRTSVSGGAAPMGRADSRRWSDSGTGVAQRPDPGAVAAQLPDPGERAAR